MLPVSTAVCCRPGLCTRRTARCCFRERTNPCATFTACDLAQSHSSVSTWLTWQSDRPHCAPRTRPGAVSDSAHIHARLPQPATCLGRNNRSPLQSIGRSQPHLCTQHTGCCYFRQRTQSMCNCRSPDLSRSNNQSPRNQLAAPAQCAPSTLPAAISDSASNPCTTATAHTCPNRRWPHRSLAKTRSELVIAPCSLFSCCATRHSDVASQLRNEPATDTRRRLKTMRRQQQPIHDRAPCHVCVVQPLLWLCDSTRCRHIAALQ